MIRTKLILAAQGISRDAETNSVSVFSIFDGIAGNGFPLFVQAFGLLVILERDPAADPAQYQAVIEIKQGDQVLVHGESNINFLDKKRARHIVRVNGFTVPVPGTVTCEFSVPTVDLHATYSFDVERIGPPIVAEDA